VKSAGLEIVSLIGLEIGIARKDLLELFLKLAFDLVVFVVAGKVGIRLDWAIHNSNRYCFFIIKNLQTHTCRD
jgi:hypothetical protein